MGSDDLSRRALLHALAASVGAAVLAPGWASAVDAAHDAHMANQAADAVKMAFFSPAEAADVEAVTAQIIPTDDTPGAREAGVVYFIDRALASFLSQLGGDYRAQLAEFQATFRSRHSGAASFAAVSLKQQIEYLQTVDRSPFFESTRLLTLLGMFSMSVHGGNRDNVGWKLIGFENRHFFQPPFGYYDRDYPGFVTDRASRP